MTDSCATVRSKGLRSLSAGSPSQAGGVAEDEMFRTFNMGIGMLVVVGRESADAARAADAGALVLGEVVSGRGVQLV